MGHVHVVFGQTDPKPRKEPMKLGCVLASREDFYSKAQFQLDTSRQPLQETFIELRDLVRNTLQLESSTVNAL